MFTKTYKVIGFLALSGLFVALISLIPNGAKAVENLPITPAADKIVILKALPAGFYQFNNLEIFKGPVVDEPPATIEVIQKNEKSCVVYESGKVSQPIPCVFDGDQNNNFTVLIDEQTTLLGASEESALISDCTAGDHINVLARLAADSKTIRAVMIRNLETKNFHQSFSGTIKKVNSDGFTLTLTNGDEIFVKTPIMEGTQVTVKGVFDKVNSAISNVLSIFIKPTIVLQEKLIEEPTPPLPSTPSVEPSTLFKNFLKIFGL